MNKKKKNTIFITIILFSFCSVYFLLSSVSKNHFSTEKIIISKLIDNFSYFYSTQDINNLENLFTNDALVWIDYKDGIKRFSIEEWLTMSEDFFNINNFVQDELEILDIKILKNTAIVYCSYNLLSETEVSSGYDIFSILKINGKWRIFSLVYGGN